MNVWQFWRDFLDSVRWRQQDDPPDVLDDPNVRRAQHEADELQDTVRHLQAQYDLRNWSSGERHTRWPREERRFVKRDNPPHEAQQ